MGHWHENYPREPSRQEQQAALPEVPRHRSRKDRARWCGGHEGREHVLVIRMSKMGLMRINLGGPHPCRWVEECSWESTLVGERVVRTWTPTGRYYWRCEHERGCERCGKVLGIGGSVGRECPDHHEREG
jgi:hypothetical protein